MCVPCSANKCRIRESDLQTACLYIIFLNGYKPSSLNKYASIKRPSETFRRPRVYYFQGCAVSVCCFKPPPKALYKSAMFSSKVSWVASWVVSAA